MAKHLQKARELLGDAACHPWRTAIQLSVIYVIGHALMLHQYDVTMRFFVIVGIFWGLYLQNQRAFRRVEDIEIARLEMISGMNARQERLEKALQHNTRVTEKAATAATIVAEHALTSADMSGILDRLFSEVKAGRKRVTDA